MFQVVDRNNGTIQTVYSVKSYTEHTPLTEGVEYGTRLLTNCVEVTLTTDFLMFNEHYNEWVWVSAEEFKPLSQGVNKDG